MVFKFLLAFALCAVVANATELRCTYGAFTYPKTYYACDGRITTKQSDFNIERVTGDHIPGKTSEEVTTVIINGGSLEVMPRNLKTWFRNYREMVISRVPNFSGFRRTDMGEYTHLTLFYAGYMPMIRKIEKDTFYDMKDLTGLYLEEMIDMGNLDADLLVNNRKLETFSARGPNRITQITPGFFRNQGTTLKIVDFRGTNLMRVGYTVFENLSNLQRARFYDAGCLDFDYKEDVVRTLTEAIRKSCKDVTERRNNISKQQLSSSSSSDSTEEK